MIHPLVLNDSKSQRNLEIEVNSVARQTTLPRENQQFRTFTLLMELQNYNSAAACITSSEALKLEVTA